MLERSQNPSDIVYVELVRSLFATAVPTIIMSLVFMLGAGLIIARQADAILIAISLAGLVASLLRIGTVLVLRRAALSERLGHAEARMLEIWFTVTYLIFATCLGAFGARVFTLTMPEAHMVTICLLVGYCAGVAAGAGLRPRIAIPSMAIAILPTILVSALRLDALYAGTSVIATAFLAGGCYSVLVRHRITMKEIGMRVTFGSLARHDGLTALPNRLALREWFEERFTHARDDGTVAVHYLDLDGFKPVNDQFGHIVGDALLNAVGGRLTAAVRAGDIVARLGGDEFAIIQCGLRHPQECELLVQRLEAAMRQPFRIGEQDLHISACIGTATSIDRGRDLETLLIEADQALYAAKRRGRGSACRSAA